MSGIPAAINDPRVNSSTMNATTTPTASDGLSPGTETLNAEPPYDTCAPSGSASCKSFTPFFTPASAAAGIWSVVPSIWTVSRAALLSSLRPAGTSSAKGYCTPRTPSVSSRFSARLIIELLYGSSSTDSPSAATTIICPLEPLTSGKVRLSVSSASCDSVPGISIGSVRALAQKRCTRAKHAQHSDPENKDQYTCLRGPLTQCI